MAQTLGQGSFVKRASSWLGLWAGAPLAVAFGFGALDSPKLTAPPPPPVAIASSAAPSEVQSAEPSAYCASRFLSALRGMAGLTPEPLDNRTEKVRVVGKQGLAEFEAEVAPEKRDPGKWLDRVGLVAGELARTFGNASGPAAIESMIATVPDPVDTGLGYQFDTHLRALRRGLEHPLENAFFRDRSWLPWDDRESEPNRRRESEECRVSTPGVMLFRSENLANPRLYALLLVGESPTSGLRQSQMVSALDAQARLDALGGEPANTGLRPVRILGPTFSGSAQSMRAVLAKWSLGSSSKTDFQVLSGTATGSAVPDWLGPSSGLPGGGQIRFAATVAPESTAECSYLWFLHNRLDVSPELGFDEEIHASKRGVPLAGVATLSESGTEFGATVADTKRATGSERAASQKPELGPVRNPPCRWAASSNFHFPFHVSVLRDAYEDLDRRESQSQKEVAIARATGLEASLRDARPPLEIEANPSDKTRAAEDIALGGLIERISTRRIRHVAIHATDVGDAIFLARRIRDVAPDVRIAFFGSDALLLHPNFRRDVLGSLVVTSYPFLGLSEFDQAAGALGPDQPRPRFEAFENGNAQGVYNAMLAQRGAAPNVLSEYTIGAKNPLPIWISTIGRGRLLATQVRPTLDCASTLYRNQHFAGAPGERPALEPEVASLCRPESSKGTSVSRAQFKEKQSEALHLQPNATRPRLWDLLFAVLCFAFLLDVAHQNVVARRFAQDPFPEHFEPANDQQFDRAIARTKCRLYATVRSFLFVLAFSYMGVLYLLEFVARVEPGASSSITSWPSFVRATGLIFGACVIGAAVILAWVVTGYSAGRFLRHYREFRRCVFSVPSARQSVPDRVGLGLGLRPPNGRHEVAHTSFAQLRLLAGLSLGISCVFSAALVADTLNSADWFESWRVDRVPRLTMTAIRDMDLTSGVSPSAPALLCMLCVYVWAVSRMQRIALAHSTSRASPPDGETDLVSTPIRLILYPGRTGEKGEDAGFTSVERDVANAIWRPITGRICVTATLGMGFFPLVLFTLKPFSTLEGWSGSVFLGGGLALSVFLIGVTLVQEVQHWFLLQRLLKRTMEHPLGAAFGSVPSFARDSVDHQVSRSPDELLRWAACARQFHDLTRSLDATGEFEPLAGEKHALEASAAALCRARVEALAGQELPEPVPPELDANETPERASDVRESTDAVPISFPLSREEDRVQARSDEKRTTLAAKLAEGVIAAASRTTELLERAWQARAALPSEVSEVKEARISGQVEVSWNALASAGGMPSPMLAGGEGDSWRPPRAVATVTGSSIPPSAPVARSSPRSSGPSEAAGSTRDALTPLEGSFSSAQLAWLRAAQTFVATVVTLLLHRHVRQFRYFLSATTLCGLLLLLAASSYPFEPHRLILTFIWIVTLSVAGTGLWIFIQMDRNTLMSHIAGTSPNEVTFDGQLVLRILAWAVVPLLGVAAAQYPELANLLLRVVSPFARALH